MCKISIDAVSSVVEDASAVCCGHTASTNTTPPSVNPEDSLIRENYAFAFPFILRVPPLLCHELLF